MNKKHIFPSFLVATLLIFSNIVSAFGPENFLVDTPPINSTENIESIVSTRVVPRFDDSNTSNSQLSKNKNTNTVKQSPVRDIDISPIKLPGWDSNLLINPTPFPTTKIIKKLPPTKDILLEETEAILKYGMSNSTNVQIIQKELIKRGYFNGTADGNYNQMTATSVSNFQKDNNISGDGMIVGPVTLKALEINLLEDKPILLDTSCDNYEYITQWRAGVGDNGEFLMPQGVTTDSLGNVYVADTFNHRIQKFTSDGKYLTQWKTLNNSNDRLFYPTAVTTDSLGNVYVADNVHRILKFTSDGKYLTQWGTRGSQNGQFQEPNSIATDSFGYVYVSDSINHRIQKFTSDGKYLTQWGVLGSGDGQFTYSTAVATDSLGNVYVADASISVNNRIQKFTSDGKYLTQWGTRGSQNGQFNDPTSIATDSFGNVYVADTYNNRIQKFTSDGKYLTQFGYFGSNNSQFHYPMGISINSFGDLYVADTGNNRVQKFGCTTTPIPVPKITVMSPNGEEVFMPGQTIEVNWKTENLLPTAQISIVLEDVYNNSYTSFDILTDNDGGHEFTLPSVATYPGLKYGKNFKLRISVEPHIGTGNRITDTSDTTFTIQDTTSTNCSIEIFSVDPSIVEVGQSYTINWKTVGCPFVDFRWLFPSGEVISSGIRDNSTGSTIMIATEDMIGVTNITLTASPFVGGGYGKQKTISLTVIPAKVICNINSFVVPSSTTIASGLSTTVSWSSNCKDVVLQANSGSSTKRYVGGASGTYTFSVPSQPGLIFSTKDKTVDITMIAGSDYDVVSQTKSVIISDVTSPASNQCAFSSVTATPNPVPTGSSEVTLSWVAPTGCIVYVQAWAPTEGVPKVTSIFKPNTLSFKATDSIKTTISKSTTYYLTAHAGSIIGTTNNTSVLSATTVDVKKK